MLRERALERLVAEVAQFDPDLVDPAVLHEAAGALGFTIPHSRAVVLLELTASTVGPEVLRTVRATYQHAQDIVAIRSATRCVVLADLRSRDAGRLEELAQHVADQLSASSGRAVAGISEGAATLEELRDACRDAEDALRIGATIRPDHPVVRIRELRLPQALASLPRMQRRRLVESGLGPLAGEDQAELTRTLVAWCESGFNLVAASAALHVHRNTLIYRLDKLEQLLGRPWRDHRAMIAAYVAALAGQLAAD